MTKSLFHNDTVTLSAPLRLAVPDEQQMDPVSRSLNTPLNPKIRIPTGQQIATQATTCAISCISLLASLLALYWFWRMKRLFRHKLIMILIFADIGRSFWYFIFTSVALAGRNVHTSTAFCQLSGFLTQVAIEGADVAVLIIAVHTALQVFRPKPLGSGPGGLYDFRFAVYAFAALYPLTMASLAFIQGRHAYFYQGLPVCNLPVRPFWYRLAISWIPRYVIFCTIIGINVAIYIHAGLGSDIDSFYSRKMSMFGRRSTVATTNSPSLPEKVPSLVFLSDSLSPDVQKEYLSTAESSPCHSRKVSNGTTLLSSTASLHRASDGSMANLKSHRWTPNFEADHNIAAHAIIEETQQQQDHEEHIIEESSPEGQPETRQPRQYRVCPHTLRDMLSRTSMNVSRAKTTSTKSQVDPVGLAEIRARRETARRQLRLMFVYPIVYFLIWLMPFVNHLTQYSANFAQHPVYALTILAWISIASMGMVDALIFSLRERPWRHIPGSDGTFWGSFAFWRQIKGPMYDSHDSDGSMDGTQHSPQRRGSTSSFMHWSTFLSAAATGEEDGEHFRETDVNQRRGRRRSSGTVLDQINPQSAQLDAMHSWKFGRGAAAGTGDDLPVPVPTKQQHAASLTNEGVRAPERSWFDRRLSRAFVSRGSMA